MAQRNVTDEAFVTLATNDVYCRGALVLAESLKRHGTARRLVVMITPHVSAVARNALSEVFDFVTDVNVLDSNDAAHLALLKRPELGITFTKIHCWTLTQFKKCVFMDADMLALTNVDELFDREEISAASDSGWPDLFNSGLFVFRPSMETFYGLLQLAEREGSFDGGDQGLLNTYFSSWLTSDISRHLSFLYNLHVTASYTYLPAFKRFGKDTKVVHFLGPVKPWHHVYNRISGAVKQVAGPQDQGYQQFPAFLTRWWEIYNDKIRNFFSNEDEITHVQSLSSHAPRPRERDRHSLSTAPNVDVSQETHRDVSTGSETSQEQYHPPEAPPSGGSVSAISEDQDNVNVYISTAGDVHIESEDSQSEASAPSGVSDVSDVDKEVKDLLMAEEISALSQIIVIPAAFIPPENEARHEYQSGESSSQNGSHRTPEQIKQDLYSHMRDWEEGRIDYKGRDSFANIQAHIDANIKH